MRIPKQALLTIGIAASTSLLITGIALHNNSPKTTHLALNNSSITQPAKPPLTVTSKSTTPATQGSSTTTTLTTHISTSSPTSQTSAAPANNQMPPSNQAPTNQPNENNQPGNEQTVTITLPHLISATYHALWTPDPAAGTNYYIAQCSQTYSDGSIKTWTVGTPQFIWPAPDPNGNAGVVCNGASQSQ